MFPFSNLVPMELLVVSAANFPALELENLHQIASIESSMLRFHSNLWTQVHLCWWDPNGLLVFSNVSGVFSNFKLERCLFQCQKCFSNFVKFIFCVQ